MASLSMTHQNEAMKESMAPHEEVCKIERDKVYGGLHLDYSTEESCDLPNFQLPPEVSLDEVTSLDLENRNLRAIPSLIFQMPNLRKLNLRHTCLKFVPHEISKLQKLQVLKLAVNFIRKLPDSICQMENLEILHLGSNELRKLPKKFGQLKLKELWINDNYLTCFPTQLTKITSLKKLDAHGNDMKTMPEAIRNLSNVTFLDMHKNKLISLPRAIVLLLKSKLKHFFYHANKIGSRPMGFDQVIPKTNDTPPNCKDKKQKSLGIKKKQTNEKSSKSASTTEVAKVKDDVVVNTTGEQALPVTSVQESSELHMADRAQLIAAMCEEKLYSPVVARDDGAKAIYIGSVTIVNHHYQTTGENNADSPKAESTMDTKDPLNDLIRLTAETACADFKNIARQLDLSENDIERIQQENQQRKECCIKALDLWRKRQGKDATVEILMKALRAADRNDVADAFEDANPEFQDVTTCDSGQEEEETCIKEAAGSSYNVESDRRRHSPRDLPTSDQVQDPQATTQPESTLPKQPIKEGNRRSRCEPPNTPASYQETRAPNDNSRSRPSTCACGQPTSTESQPGRRNGQQSNSWSFNRQANKRRAELNQDQTEGVRRHQSRPGPNSSAGHETGAPNRYKLRFPWNKNKPRV